MWRDTYREKVGGETRTRWSGNHGLEKKRNSEGKSEIPRQRNLEQI